MDGALSAKRLLGEALAAAMVLAAACWLCLYPVLFVVSGLAVLLFTSQGTELLESPGAAAMFHGAVAAWALAAWYCSRVLLKRRFEGRFASRVLDADDRFTRFVRIALPRALGALVYVSLAGHYFAARQPGQASIVLVCGVAYGLFVVYRRTVLARAEPAALRRERLESATRIVLALSLAGSFALLADLLALGERRWSLLLSSAVHLSARFAYVSPAAKICVDAAARCDAEHVWGRVVDGGYHENSGAQTAADLLRALRRAARRFEQAQPPGPTRVQARVVMITNDVGSTRLCEAAPAVEPARWYAELLSPARALWSSRVARGAEARRTLADAAAGLRRDPLDKDCAGDATRANTLEFSLAAAHRPARTPALGWFLAAGSTQVMDEALCRPEHVRALESARHELGAGVPYACRAQL